MPSLTLQVLQDNNTVTNSIDFYPAEDVELRVQIIENETAQQFNVPDLGRTFAFVLPGNPTNVSIADADINIDSRNSSIISTIIPDTTTANLTSGNVRLIINYYQQLSAPDLTAYTVSQNAKLTIGTTVYSFDSDGQADGTFTITDVTDLALAQIGLITDDNSTDGVQVEITSVAGGSPFTIGVTEVTQKTRMAQLKNGMRRLTPNPVVS